MFLFEKTSTAVTPSDQSRTDATTVDDLMEPFGDVNTAVKLLADVTGMGIEEVTERLQREHKQLGSNVGEELHAWKIPPFEWSDQLVDFYSQSQAFLFESYVWNSTSMKQSLRQWIVRHLRPDANNPIKVLSYGDGLGFDAAFMAKHGCDTTYFEVGQPCVEFAEAVFRLNEVSVRVVPKAIELPEGAFDVVMCLDVLEHVPNPPELIERLATYLRPGGKLVIHAPFWYIHRDVKTHLKSNVRFSGRWRQLYEQSGLRPVDAAALWCPIVLEKSETAKPANLAARIRLLSSAWLLAVSRISPLPLVTFYSTFLRPKPGFAIARNSFKPKQR